MTEATVWPTFAPNRACQLCDHGRSEGCKRLEVSGVARSTSFNAARALGGACGPDARYLTIKGFDYSKETP